MTSIIGIHAIFGAFVVGIIMPKQNGLARHLTEKIEDLVSVLFLPIVRLMLYPIFREHAC